MGYEDVNYEAMTNSACAGPRHAARMPETAYREIAYDTGITNAEMNYLNSLRPK